VTAKAAREDRTFLRAPATEPRGKRRLGWRASSPYVICSRVLPLLRSRREDPRLGQCSGVTPEAALNAWSVPLATKGQHQ
jgi:hypothetical protein